MKTIIVLVTLVLSLPSFAITFEITDLCDDRPVLKEEVPVLTITNVLDFTKYHLKNFAIPSVITENGVISMLDTPTGYNAYEPISYNHMRVYGWCYEIDGQRPFLEAANYILDPESQSHLRWYYGYAEVVNGVWIHSCRPVYEARQPFVCAKN